MTNPGMTIEQLLWFLDLFDETGVTAWLDGGWSIDALLGEQTRPHSDIDIFISFDDSPKLVAALVEHDFADVLTDDHTPENFVMSHEQRGQIDFHVFEWRDHGTAMYKPWVITPQELAGNGSFTFAGETRSVRCFAPEYLVRSHGDYELKRTDAHDMKLLRDRFGVQLTAEQEAAISRFL